MGRYARWRQVVEAQGRRLHDALRQVDEPDPLTGPPPSLNRLDALVEGFVAGQPVRWSLGGAPRPLPEAVDVAAYRIIEEALTDACRHAPGAAVAVRLRYDDQGITIEVRDDGGPPVEGAARAGGGLPAVRRRVERVGGTLNAGPNPDGGFTVRAFLPAPEEAVG